MDEEQKLYDDNYITVGQLNKLPNYKKMKKYKVVLTYEKTVEAENEGDAKLIAYDNVFASSYSEADVEEIKPQTNERKV